MALIAFGVCSVEFEGPWWELAPLQSGYCCSGLHQAQVGASVCRMCSAPTAGEDLFLAVPPRGRGEDREHTRGGNKRCEIRCSSVCRQSSLLFSTHRLQGTVLSEVLVLSCLCLDHRLSDGCWEAAPRGRWRSGQDLRGPLSQHHRDRKGRMSWSRTMRKWFNCTYCFLGHCFALTLESSFHCDSTRESKMGREKGKNLYF